MEAIRNRIRTRNLEFVSLLVAIIGVAISLIVYFLQRDLKSLDVKVLSATSLIEVSDTIKDKIQVSFENKAVYNLSVFDVRIRNSGNQPILPSDFIEPLAFVFSNDAGIVEADIIESNPSNVGMKINIAQNKVLFSKSLLNEGDEITIRIFTINNAFDSGTLPFTVDGRIIGVKQIKVSPTASSQSTTISLSLSVISLISTLASILGIYFGARITRSRPEPIRQ